jgi:hypothetical protein
MWVIYSCNNSWTVNKNEKKIIKIYQQTESLSKSLQYGLISHYWHQYNVIIFTLPITHLINSSRHTDVGLNRFQQSSRNNGKIFDGVLLKYYIKSCMDILRRRATHIRGVVRSLFKCDIHSRPTRWTHCVCCYIRNNSSLWSANILQMHSFPFFVFH